MLRYLDRSVQVDINSCKVVQVSTIFLCPSVIPLRFLISFVCMPSISWIRLLSRGFYFPMVILPSFSSVFRSSRVVFLHGTERDRHDLKSSFLCFWSVLTKAPGVNHMCNKKCSFFVYLGHVGRWTVLEIFPNSKSSIFFNSLIVRLMLRWTCWMFLSSPKSLMIDLVWYPACSSSTISNFGHSLLIFMHCILWYSMNTEIDLKRVLLSYNNCLRCCFPAPSQTLCSHLCVSPASVSCSFPNHALLQLLLPIPGIFENFFWSWPRWKHAIFVSQSVSPFFLCLGQ